MVFTGGSRHVGYVAGRYRNGALSDAWTDVSRCAPGTFTAFAAACQCGWRGPLVAATAQGHLTCRRAIVHEHLACVTAPIPRIDPDLAAAG